jgi:putative acetyltransferase
VASPDLTIRFEREGDAAAIREVNRTAFATQAEADLVDRLRQLEASVVSLVAQDGGSIDGHILFSRVSLTGREPLPILGLAPLAVRPDRQRQGIGSQLVRAGLDAGRQTGAGAVVVVGHARFYPRFGFVPASRFGLTCEYDVPDEVFMALELVPGFFAGQGGLVQYHPAFAEL